MSVFTSIPLFFWLVIFLLLVVSQTVGLGTAVFLGFFMFVVLLFLTGMVGVVDHRRRVHHKYHH